MVPCALTIAGSDSGGCAGIQADLKTFAALGVHGMSAITAVTAQDSSRVHSTEEISLQSIQAQVRAVLDDFGADAVKTGMLPSTGAIELVAALAVEYGVENLVVDPVMVSTGGDRLIRPQAIQSFRKRLLPLAAVATPNLLEAEALTDSRIRSQRDREQACRRFLQWGCRAVVLKGGHGTGPRSDDLFLNESGFETFSAPRVDTKNTHGSGCTFASAIAAFLA
ncbi:MAG TPA: bifunctional hydroxymethylpyrimidine kinase/phosphomethylpyrimidine kinase, partial [Acidobacteriota bacterium]|nr:bifunctional hydroxymethylpyrimidine kinase/phosphomethylpyrimidine kinase [Acidobacteriota bacterium]